MKSDLEAARNRLAQYLSRRSKHKMLSFEDIHSFDAEVHLTASDIALVIDALDVQPAATGWQDIATAPKEEARHFYCFSFQYSAGTTVSTGSLYVGYPDQKITRARLNQAKLDAGMHPKSVAMGISYMGHMTLAEMTGEPPS